MARDPKSTKKRSMIITAEWDSRNGKVNISISDPANLGTVDLVRFVKDFGRDWSRVYNLVKDRARLRDRLSEILSAVESFDKMPANDKRDGGDKMLRSSELRAAIKLKQGVQRTRSRLRHSPVAPPDFRKDSMSDLVQKAIMERGCVWKHFRVRWGATVAQIVSWDGWKDRIYPDTVISWLGKFGYMYFSHDSVGGTTVWFARSKRGERRIRTTRRGKLSVR